MNVDSLTFSTPNGLSAISAVIQVCVNQQYGYVCADNWDDKEADVACRSFRSWYQSPYYGINVNEPRLILSLQLLSHRKHSFNNISKFYDHTS